MEHVGILGESIVYIVIRTEYLTVVAGLASDGDSLVLAPFATRAWSPSRFRCDERTMVSQKVGIVRVSPVSVQATASSVVRTTSGRSACFRACFPRRFSYWHRPRLVVPAGFRDGSRLGNALGVSRVSGILVVGAAGQHGGKMDVDDSEFVDLSGTIETVEIGRVSSSRAAQYELSHSPSTSSSLPSRRSEIIMTTREKIKESNVAMFVLGGAAAVGLHYLVRFVGTLPVVKYFVKRYLWWAEPKLRSKDYLSMLSSGSYDESDDEEGDIDGVGGQDSMNGTSNERNNRRIGRGRRVGTGRGRRGVSSTTNLIQDETGLISFELASEDDEYDRDAQGNDQEGGEPVEWVNMCWRKAWRVYQRGLERWLAGLLQPVFDNVVKDKVVPAFVQKLKITEFTLDHEAPYFTNMKRRSSRKDSDLNGVVDVRYTGGARMVLSVELGFSKNRSYRLKVPVMVSDLDLECKLWLKLRLAPMCPYVGTLSMAFVGPPTIKLQLSPYDRIKLMRIPVIQPFLTKLFTVDLPRLMTLPKRLEIAIPPAVTAVAEAAIGRDAVMRAVASAVLQADALEHALVSALPLGPQGAAGGISLPDLFRGELQVVLKGAKNLPVWGFPWQSNPYCRLALGDQAVRSRKDNETSQRSRHRGPVWNQEFQFLVEDTSVQALEIWIMDSPMTGRTDVAYAKIPLSDIPSTGNIEAWFDLDSTMPAESSGGAVRLSLTYRPFQDDENDSGYREAAAQAFFMEEEEIESEKIIDIKSAADASSRAAVAASAAAAAVAVTKAAAARAAARLSRGVAGEETREEAESGGADDNAGDEAEASLPREEDAAAAPAQDSDAHDQESASRRSHGDISHGNGGEDDQEMALDDNNQEMITELSNLTDSLHHLTDDVKSLSSSDMLSLAHAEREAVSAVARGDVHEANEVLHEAALSIERHQQEEVDAQNKAQSEVSGEEKAERALTAAKAALAALEGDVASSDETGSISDEGPQRYHVISSASDIEDSLGAEAIPNIEETHTQEMSAGGGAGGKSVTLTDARDGDPLTAGKAGARGTASGEANTFSEQQNIKTPWWSIAAGWVMDRLPGQASSQDDDDDLGDGGASFVPNLAQDELSPEERRKLPVGDIVIGDDIPLEEIAAEVRKSWKARDVHVETLVRKQLELRQRQTELPLLLITSVMATSSAILLSIVLYRIMHQ